VSRIRHASRLAALLLLVSACRRGEERWVYAVPRVLDERALLAELTPKKDGELVLANFWASW
jgi:hypothetical protein